MATRSRIATVADDGNIASIYCHWDGYPEGVGLTLLTYYSNTNKLRRLMVLGNISSLGSSIEECKDYGEPGWRTHATREYLVNNACAGEEYIYLFSNFEWSVYVVKDERWYNLAEILLPDDILDCTDED